MKQTVVILQGKILHIYIFIYIFLYMSCGTSLWFKPFHSCSREWSSFTRVAWNLTGIWSPAHVWWIVDSRLNSLGSDCGSLNTGPKTGLSHWKLLFLKVSEWIQLLTSRHSVTTFQGNAFGNCVVEMYWTAPELLRLVCLPLNGTPKGDVFSFAIIMWELMFNSRSGPYQDINLEPKGLQEFVH